MENLKVGISGLATYVPPYRVDLEQWCQWSDNSWDKIKNDCRLILSVLEVICMSY